jgi:hypothetical protein
VLRVRGEQRAGPTPSFSWLEHRAPPRLTGMIHRSAALLRRRPERHPRKDASPCAASRNQHRSGRAPGSARRLIRLGRIGRGCGGEPPTTSASPDARRVSVWKAVESTSSRWPATPPSPDRRARHWPEDLACRSRYRRRPPGPCPTRAAWPCAWLASRPFLRSCSTDPCGVVELGAPCDAFELVESTCHQDLADGSRVRVAESRERSSNRSVTTCPSPGRRARQLRARPFHRRCRRRPDLSRGRSVATWFWRGVLMLPVRPRGMSGRAGHCCQRRGPRLPPAARESPIPPRVTHRRPPRRPALRRGLSLVTWHGHDNGRVPGRVEKSAFERPATARWNTLRVPLAPQKPRHVARRRQGHETGGDPRSRCDALSPARRQLSLLRAPRRRRRRSACRRCARPRPRAQPADRGVQQGNTLLRFRSHALGADVDSTS